MVIDLIVYVDVLIFLNIIIDYFLLLIVAKLAAENVRTMRVVTASILGGFFSLYIFWKLDSKAADIFIKFIFAIIMVLVCFGGGKIKRVLKNSVIFFAVSSGYSGLMFFLWSVFKPQGMFINNSIVYFSISPTVLVISSAVGYLVFALLWKIFKKSAPFSEQCDVTVYAFGNSVNLCAMLDTGNSLEDVFEKSEIIISDKFAAESLFGEIDVEKNGKLKSRYRVLPCGTVSGIGTLEGYRCDSAIVEYSGKRVVLEKPLLAISRLEFADGCNAIINPRILGWLL